MRFIMQTCPQREAVFRDTIAHAPSQTEIVMDTGGGNLRTFLKAMEQAGTDPFVFLEDDLIFTSDFEAKVDFVVKSWPFTVVSMFAYNSYMQDDPVCPPFGDGQPALRSGAHLESNLCVYYPPGMAQAVLLYHRANWSVWRAPDHQHGDMLVREYMKSRGLRVLHYVPDLVQHKDGPSISMPKNRHRRVSRTFRP